MGLGYDQLLNHWNTFANIYVASEHHLNLNISIDKNMVKETYFEELERCEN